MGFRGCFCGSERHDRNCQVWPEYRKLKEMSHWEKAEENLEAARQMLPSDENGWDGFNNAAASRAYYATYLVIVEIARRRGIPYTNQETGYFVHATLPEDAFHWGILGETTRRRLRILQDLRVKADYHSESCDSTEAFDAVDKATDVASPILSLIRLGAEA